MIFNWQRSQQYSPSRYLQHSLGALAILTLLILAPVFSCASQNENSIPMFDEKNAYAQLVRQCDFGPRNPGSMGHLKCRDYLVATLKEYTKEVRIQPFPMAIPGVQKPVDAFNIIAKFNPEKTERIVLCAHWDTRPWADKDADPSKHNTPILGANDGASGVAVLLEMARIFHAQTPPIGVDIVLFDGEDAGDSGKGWIQGSEYYAQSLKPADHPLFAILLDMIGDKDLQIYKESYSVEYARDIVKMVWDKAAELGVKQFKDSERYAMLDDHIPLLRIGIPCIDLIDFDYPYWHTTLDTPDNCSAASLGQVGKVIVHVIYTQK
jgi:glutaminyl-peptide cyclotransferase